MAYVVVVHGSGPVEVELCGKTRKGKWKSITLPRERPNMGIYRDGLTLWLLPQGKIYDLPKIFCKQTTIPVLMLVPNRVPLHNVHKQ